MDQLKPGTFWWYKDVQYRVLELNEQILSQDAQGNWVPTVYYQSVNRHLGVRFSRPWTEFVSKFGIKHG